jgi:arylsulfatase A-like enzyme
VVGRVTDALDRAGLADSTYTVLMADHGMAPVSPACQFDLLHWLRNDRGLRLRTAPVGLREYSDRYDLLKRYDAVAHVDAGRVAMVHLAGRRGWVYRPEPAEVVSWMTTAPAAQELPAVEVALARAGPDRVHVLSRDGAAVVERRSDGGVKAYRLLIDRGDPLGYRVDPGLSSFIDEGWHTSREWLVATAGSRCPDFVPQVVEMFDSPRTGDVVLLAAEGWSFYRRGEVAGHGSCLARDMRIPLYFAGPDLPKGATVDFARLVDLTPTVLGLLGEAHRLDGAPAIDGIDLADRLRQARPRARGRTAD